MTIRYSRSERLHHLDAWRQSGMSKKHYCRLHDLNPATFYYWLKHHQDDTTVAVPAAIILARRVAPECHDTDMVTLNLPNGCSVRCSPAQDPDELRTLALKLLADLEQRIPCS
jgi:transposase-like protein